MGLIRYRPFLNTDPPHLVGVWRSQPPHRGLAQPMSLAWLEEYVLSRPAFDRRGLIVAAEGEKPVGFVHAGFGPSANRSGLDRTCGVIGVALAAARSDRAVLLRELLAQGEAYLRGAGAVRILGGGRDEACPFYLGLYGGTAAPGVLASDELAVRLFTEAGYAETGRRVILQRKLADFRPPVDRELVQFRRQAVVTAEFDVPPRDWWEAGTRGHGVLSRFTLKSRGQDLGSVTLWDVEPLARCWGAVVAGFTGPPVMAAGQPPAAAAFLACEALRLSQTRGATLSEVQLDATDAAGRTLFAGLGFTQVDEGIAFEAA